MGKRSFQTSSPLLDKLARNWLYFRIVSDHSVLMTNIALSLLYLSNVWYAVAKKSLSASVPMMKRDIGFTNKNLGDCSANFSILYGSFKLIGGVMSDLVSENLLFSLGLLFGSIINLIIPFMPNVNHVPYIWGFNGLLQGVGGPALSKIVLENVPSNKKTSVWSNLLTANNVGYLLSPYLLLLPSKYLGWKGPFWFAGTIGLCIALSSLLFPLSHSSFSQSSQSQNKDTKKQSNSTDNSHSRPTPSTVSPTTQTFRFFGTLLLILSNSLVYFILKAVSDWKVQYLLEFFKVDYSVAIEVAFWCEIGGMLGSYLAGLVADQYPQLRCQLNIGCALVALVFFLPMLPLHAVSSGSSVPLLWLSSMSIAEVNSWAYRACLFGLGMSLNGPKALLLLQATQETVKFCQPYYRDKKSIPTGTISGTIGFLAQIGASGSGYIMGHFLELSLNWYWWILFVAGWGLLLSLFLAWILFVLESCFASFEVSTFSEQHMKGKQKAS